MDKIILCKPYKGDYPMTQPFGVMFQYNGRNLKHLGIDHALPKDTPLLACFDGEVVRVEEFRLKGYGKSVYIRSADGVFDALYAHLTTIYVKVGQKVKVCEIVASSGNTGFWRGKTGYHLHFGLKQNGEYVDPVKFLNVKSGPVNLFATDEYIVEAGDTLSKIAAKFFVASDMWPLIYQKNKKEIGANPDLIRPGLKIIIPKAGDLITNLKI